ncbi:MAG: hypothetical protein AB7G37_12860 [Solirubrobacteraceae bacterium]
MPTRLEDRFLAAEGAPVEVDGQLVHMMFEFPPITEPATLRIHLEVGSSRPQGVRLKARGGKLGINEQLVDDVVLWSDSAPPTVTAEVRPQKSGKPVSLRLWNVWLDPAGTMQGWIGDAGILLEAEQPGTTVLRCSDGFNAPTFDDLVVTVALEPGA